MQQTHERASARAHTHTHTHIYTYIFKRGNRKREGDEGGEKDARADR